jgi:hypothetical protein
MEKREWISSPFTIRNHHVSAQSYFGGRLRRRGFDAQAIELFLQCAALNRMIQLGKPDSYKVED